MKASCPSGKPSTVSSRCLDGSGGSPAEAGSWASCATPGRVAAGIVATMILSLCPAAANAQAGCNNIDVVQERNTGPACCASAYNAGIRGAPTLPNVVCAGSNQVATWTV